MSKGKEKGTRIRCYCQGCGNYLFQDRMKLHNFTCKVCNRKWPKSVLGLTQDMEKPDLSGKGNAGHSSSPGKGVGKGLGKSNSKYHKRLGAQEFTSDMEWDKHLESLLSKATSVGKSEIVEQCKDLKKAIEQANSVAPESGMSENQLLNHYGNKSKKSQELGERLLKKKQKLLDEMTTLEAQIVKAFDEAAEQDDLYQKLLAKMSAANAQPDAKCDLAKIINTSADNWDVDQLMKAKCKINAEELDSRAKIELDAIASSLKIDIVQILANLEKEVEKVIEEKVGTKVTEVVEGAKKRKLDSRPPPPAPTGPTAQTAATAPAASPRVEAPPTVIVEDGKEKEEQEKQAKEDQEALQKQRDTMMAQAKEKLKKKQEDSRGTNASCG